MQYRRDPCVFGEHDICQSFDLALQYSVRSGTRIRVFAPFCCRIIFEESTTEEVARTYPPTYQDPCSFAYKNTLKMCASIAVVISLHMKFAPHLFF